MKKIKPKQCSFCKGELEEGLTEFIAKVGDQVIVLQEVPAWICNNCGESFFSPKTSRKLDIVMKKVHEGNFIARPLAAGKLKLSEIAT